MLDVKIILNFVTLDDNTNRFKIFLDDKGDIPTIDLNQDSKINDVIFNTASNLFYNLGGAKDFFNSLNLSGVEKLENILYITYNVFCYNEFNCKIGKFVNFDKNSVELYRFASNKGLQ